MNPHTSTEHARLFNADLRRWPEVLAPGSVVLSHIDGPYDLRKADWDCLTDARKSYAGIPGEADRVVRAYLDLLDLLGDRRGADLVAWYAPILHTISEASAASASAYLWNTDAGEALLRPVMQALGWTFRGRVTWEKPDGPAIKSAYEGGNRTWADVTEACGFYQREAWTFGGGAGSTIAHAANADERNPCTAFFIAEREAAGMTRRDLAAYFPSKTGGLTGCVSNWEGGQNFPTWEVWARCAAAMAEKGPPRDRPYLVLPAVWGQAPDPLRASYDHLRAEYDHLRAEYDHLRAEYEASRPPFSAPVGVSNVWTAPTVGGDERLKIGGEAHPCQKPIVFAERVLLASSRPGDLVVDWFGGTCRLAVANARLPLADRRQIVAFELDRRYLDAVAPSLSFVAAPTGGHPSLFGEP